MNNMLAGAYKIAFVIMIADVICATEIRTKVSREPTKAPIAIQRPHKVTFGAVEGENRGDNPFKDLRYRDDPWFWLRDDNRTSKEVLDHLTKENDYTEEKTKHLNLAIENIYDEHISHLKQSDEVPPYRHGNYFYFTRTKKNLSYPFHYRQEIGLTQNGEELILDENKVCKGNEHCNVGTVKPSPDHSLIAYSVDFTGSEIYTVKLVNIKTGEMLTDLVEGTTADIEWGRDNNVFFYVTTDLTKRPYKLWKHVAGTEQKNDECLFVEEDVMFGFNIRKSRNGKFLFMNSESRDSSEVSFIDLTSSDRTVIKIQKREENLKYDVEPLPNGYFLIWSNINGAINNRLLVASIDDFSKENWKEIIPYNSARLINNVDVFRSFVAIEGRQNGLPQIWIIQTRNSLGMVPSFGIDPSTLRKIEWPDALYNVRLGVNKEYYTHLLRVEYSTMITPLKYQDYDVSHGKFILIKQKEVLNYDPSLYVSKRIMAKANDGEFIPITLTHRKEVKIGTGNTPTFLYGYGSYGLSMDPGFKSGILPYLDRGMVYAIAHIRGGGEMGNEWNEVHGKYLNKRNTFSDFINCAEHLIKENVTKPEKLAIEGRSAGGLLMGAVLNMRPDLFKVAIAGVPFVDIMNTMSDPSIPLTTGEWKEWGNPNEYKYFDYMLSYSPYDNVREQSYPNILILGGLYDPRVPYWEPAKWASKLKTLKTDNNDVLLKTDMNSGHFSSSARYKNLKDKSFEQAFVFYHLGLINNDFSYK